MESTLIATFSIYHSSKLVTRHRIVLSRDLRKEHPTLPDANRALDKLDAKAQKVARETKRGAYAVIHEIRYPASMICQECRRPLNYNLGWVSRAGQRERAKHKGCERKTYNRIASTFYRALDASL